jgi:hypothetical protein
MRPNQPRQKCDCGLTFRYDSDFQEHKRVGCVVQAGKGNTFSDKDVDELPVEEVITETPIEPESEAPKKQSRKK